MTEHYLKRITYAKNMRVEIEKLLTDVLKNAGEVLDTKDKDYLAKKFDLVIQTALIASSITDGVATPNEISFIREMEDKESVIEYFDSYAKSVGANLPPLMWEELPEIGEALDQKGRTNFVTFLIESVMKEAKLIAKCGAFAQKTTGKNYLYALEQGFIRIVYAFCEVDGDNIQEIKQGNPKLTNEVGVCNAIFKLLIKDNWKY